MKKEQIAILLCLLTGSLWPHRGSRPRPLAWRDQELPGFRVEAEAVRVMAGNSSSDVEESTAVRVR
jgi:hypothetical protein